MLYSPYKINGGDEMSKEVSIDKTADQPYYMCSIEHNRIAMRNLTKSAYYLYTYFMQNQDGYNFTLRRSHAMSITGLSKSSYYLALQELIDKHYVIDCDDGYEFYERPQENY